MIADLGVHAAPDGRRAAVATPTLVRSLGVAAVAGFVLWCAISFVLVSSRQQAARDVGLRAGPLLVHAQDLYLALGDADAIATRALLQDGGTEPAVDRQRYLDDLRDASAELAAIAQASEGSATIQAASASIAAAMPTYAAGIDTARANSRLGFPVGAAYLRTASSQMQDEILPEVTRIYDEAARQLDDAGRTGTATWSVALIVLSASMLLGLLIVAQVVVARRTRRRLNVGLSLATVLLVGIAGWMLVQLDREHDALLASQRDGVEEVQLLSTARILALRSQRDAAGALIERGTGKEYLAGFDDLIERTVDVVDSYGTVAGAAAADPIRERLDAYRTSHQQVRALDDGGRYEEAVASFLEADASEVARAADLDHELAVRAGAAQARFDQHASAARDGLAALVLGLVLTTLAAIAAVLWGTDRTLREYR